MSERRDELTDDQKKTIRRVVHWLRGNWQEVDEAMIELGVQLGSDDIVDVAARSIELAFLDGGRCG